MVPVLSILVLGKASFGKMDFSVVFRKKRAMLWVGPEPGGGRLLHRKANGSLLANPEDFVSNLGPHFLLSKSSSSGI